MTLITEHDLDYRAEHVTEPGPEEPRRWPQPMADRENPYRGIRRFFVFCSGAEPQLLWRAESEQTTYATIGGTVLATGVLATISVTVALSMSFGIFWLFALPIGLVWGAVIFNLDRWLVASYRKMETALQTAVSVIPRVLLALIFGLLISEPLILRIFDSEIQEQLKDTNAATLQTRLEALDNGDLAQSIEAKQTEIAAKRDRIDDIKTERTNLAPAPLSDPILADLEEELTGLRSRRNELTQQVAEAEAQLRVAQSALAEEVASGCADAIPGDGCRPGFGPIAQQKQELVEAAQASRDVIVTDSQREDTSIRSRIADLEEQINERRQAAKEDADASTVAMGQERQRLDQQILTIEGEIVELNSEIADLELKVEEAKQRVRAGEIETGLVARIEAFEEVKKHSSEVSFFQNLLRALFVAIDVVPIVGKWLYSLGRPKPYDQLRDDSDRAVRDDLAREADARRVGLEGGAATERYRVAAIAGNQQHLIDYAAEIQRNIGSAVLARWEAANLPPDFERVDPNNLPEIERPVFEDANFDDLDAAHPTRERSTATTTTEVPGDQADHSASEVEPEAAEAQYDDPTEDGVENGDAAGAPDANGSIKTSPADEQPTKQEPSSSRADNVGTISDAPWATFGTDQTKQPDPPTDEREAQNADVDGTAIDVREHEDVSTQFDGQGDGR